MNNGREKLSVFIMALEEMGAKFVEFSESRNVIKFDIPSGSRIDDEVKLKRAAKVLRRYDSDVRLMIKRINIPDIECVAYEDQINKMLMEIMRDYDFSSQAEFITLRDELLRKSNTTMKKFSDILADGIIEGYSIDMQLDKIRIALKFD